MRSLVLFGLIGLFIVDRMAKQLLEKAPEVLRSFFARIHIPVEAYTNSGIVFGGSLGPHTNMIIILVSIALLLVVMYLFVAAFQQNDFSTAFLWGLIFIGGVSNVFDRITQQAVLDWLVMPWSAVINLADVYITVGAIFLIARLYLDKKKV